MKIGTLILHCEPTIKSDAGELSHFLECFRIYRRGMFGRDLEIEIFVCSSFRLVNDVVLEDQG